MTPQAVRSAERLWSANKREAAQVALQTQAIQREQQEALRKVAELMQHSTQTKGARDGLQAQLQSQGLTTTAVLRVEAQLATQARVQTLQVLEAAAMQEATSQALDEASQAIDLSPPARGRLLPLSR